ncbi:MAG TPA: hypothetical protein VMW62_08605 [Chloroflexota bacterium]|nr:hypothetical protein [Chloroflexota bacterium]
MADWRYEQIAIHGPRDEDEIRIRLATGWELVGYTLRGQAARGVRHAIVRAKRAESVIAVQRPKWNRGVKAAQK